MAVHVRTSVTAGPFRFTLSGGGVGMSVGVRGFRIGTGPRGHYVQAGAGGFRYRATLPRAAPGAPAPTVRDRASSPIGFDDDLIAVTSGDVTAMRDAAFADVLHDISSKRRQLRTSTTFASMASVGCLVCLFVVGPPAIPVLCAVPLAWLAGRWLDSFRRVAVLVYDLEPAAMSAYERLCGAFAGLGACSAMWHVDAGRQVRDLTTWKREAGASHLVRRKRSAIHRELPAVLRCNVVPPTLKAGNRILHFLPDVVLVHDATGFGAVGYDTLRVAHQPANFIETEAVPRDAVVSHHTWEHPNKGGGPDRRFRSNRRLPVCTYEAMHLTSADGVNELFEFSRPGVARGVAEAVASMPRNARATGQRLVTGPRRDYAEDRDEARFRKEGSLIHGASAAVVAAAAAMAMLLLPHRPIAARAEPALAPSVAAAAAVDRFYVTVPRLKCRSGPNAADRIVRRYAAGELLEVAERRGTWWRVGSGPGGDCWVRSGNLASRRPAPAPRLRHPPATAQPVEEGTAPGAAHSALPPPVGDPSPATQPVPAAADPTGGR